MNNQIFSQPTDPIALRLTRSIALKESGNGGMTPNYNAVGDAGTSHGAYQWQPGNYENDAKKFGLDPNDRSPVNQDKVAYAHVKEKKDLGWSPDEIAASWNAGDGKAKSGAWKTNVGTTTINGQQIHYDTPSYVKGVQDYYNKLSPQSQENGYVQVPPMAPVANASDGNTPTPIPTPADNKDGLGTQLSGRMGDAGQALSDASSGKINPISGVLQAGGAVGGAIGDVTNKALELVPGVKQAEGWIGNLIGSVAKTPLGQSIAGQVKQFQDAHPELAKDMGAVFNIVTAIPILRGIGTIASVGLKGGAEILANSARKGALEDVVNGISATGKTGKSLLSKDGLSKLSDALDNKTLADNLVDSSSGVPKWSTKEAIKSIGEEKISPLDEKLQTILDGVSEKQSIGQSLSTLEKRAIQEAENDVAMKEAGVVPQAIKRIQARFEGWRYSFGDNINLAQENRLKIGSGKFSDWGTPEYSADKAIYRSLQTDIEGVAKKLGNPEVEALNKQMGRFLQAQKMLDLLHDKRIKLKPVGLAKKAIRAGAKLAGAAVGEGIGGALGHPILGTLGGYLGGNLTENIGEKVLGNGAIRRGILRRTGSEAIKTPLKKVTRRTAGLIGGATAQKLDNSK